MRYDFDWLTHLPGESPFKRFSVNDWLKKSYDYIFLGEPPFSEKVTLGDFSENIQREVDLKNDLRVSRNSKQNPVLRERIYSFQNTRSKIRI